MTNSQQWILREFVNPSERRDLINKIVRKGDGTTLTSSICRRESSVRPVRSVSCTSDAKACVIAGVSTVGDSRFSADTLGFEGSSAKIEIHLLMRSDGWKEFKAFTIWIKALLQMY